MIFNPITIDPPDAGRVISESGDGQPRADSESRVGCIRCSWRAGQLYKMCDQCAVIGYPSKVYHLADGRLRLYVNKKTERVVLRVEDETEDSLTLILTEPKEPQ